MAQREREEIQEKLKDAYNIRNNIVHGEDFEEQLKEDQYFDDFVKEVEDLLRRALRKSI